MFLHNIQINNIRNIEQLELEFPRGLIVFVGNNAQGKTNILEALYLLSHARSFRDAKNEHLIRFGQEFGAVEGTVVTAQREASVRIVIQPSARAALLNGKRCARLSELSGLVHFVTFSSTDLQIMKGSPSDRRLFLDKFVYNLFPGLMYYLREYRRILRQRNQILSQIRDRQRTISDLEIWNHQFIKFASEVMFRRIELIHRVNSLLGKRYRSISSIEELIKICYKTSLKEITDYRDIKDRQKEIKDLLLRRITERQNQEIERGHSLFGPHRDDFTIELGGRDIRYYGSQGEIRSALLAMKLVEIELFRQVRHDHPIILLDDVLSELDTSRAEYLLAGLDNDLQTFMSVTTLEMVRGSRHHSMLFTVDGGTVCEMTTGSAS